MSLSHNNHRGTEKSQHVTKHKAASSCYCIKGERKWFTGTKSGEAVRDLREKFNSIQIRAPTELPRATELCREPALRGFLPAPPCNMLFLWWSSEDFLFLISNLWTAYHRRLMVSFQVRNIHHFNGPFHCHLYLKQISTVRLPSVFCTAQTCYIWSDLNLFSCTKLKEGVFFSNRGKHGPPRGGIWVVGWIWICCQKELAVLSQIRLCFRLHWPPTAC